MPWIGRLEYLNLQVEAAQLRVQLSAEVNRRERAELELARLQDDFKGLVALTAGRVPPRMKPEFERDPFAEDPKQLETYLTPSEEETGMSIELAAEYQSKPDGDGETGEAD